MLHLELQGSVPKAAVDAGTSVRLKDANVDAVHQGLGPSEVPFVEHLLREVFDQGCVRCDLAQLLLVKVLEVVGGDCKVAANDLPGVGDADHAKAWGQSADVVDAASVGADVVVGRTEGTEVGVRVLVLKVEGGELLTVALSEVDVAE